MKRILSGIAVLLCLSLLTGCFSIATSLLTNTDLRSGGQLTTFEEIVYERPDMDAIEAQFDKTVAMHTDGTSVEDLLTELETCWSMYCDFYTMDTVAEIRSYADATDTYYAEETAFCMDAEAQMNQLFEELEIASANHENAEQLETDFWGDGLIDTYSGLTGTDDEYTGTYDDTYVALIQEESTLLSQYRSVLASATVTYMGKETSYQELLADETLSDTAVEAINTLYYNKYSEILGEIYIDLVDVRQRQAEYLGYGSYEEFAYAWVYDRDYTPEQADQLIADIRTWIAPLYRRVNEAGLWDTVSYDEVTEDDIYSAVSTVAQSLGGDISESFTFLDRHHLCDLQISNQKASISYQTYLDSYNAPYVFVKTYGYNDDILTFAHEFGHFVDSYVNYNTTYSLELSEVFSHSMEYLTLCTLPESQLGDLTTIKVLDTLDTYAQQASYAAFEQAVYAIPAEELTVEKLNELSLQGAEEFGYLAEGLENYYAKSWIDITHFFEYPFYVISYCVANDAAFQIYQMETRTEGAGLEQFEKLLPRNYDSFLDTISNQSSLESPFASDRMKKTAETIEGILLQD